MRLGMLGGTFDPIHLGHVAAAQAALKCADLDQVLLVPTNQPPHRTAAKAPAEYRLEMCRLATAEDARLQCSEIELNRPGPSFTLDTLEALHSERPDDELFLILGWDAAKLLGTWHEPDEVRRLAHVIVVTRPGSGSPATAPEMILCERPTPDISGSALRRAIAQREPLGDRVPAAVARYIAEKGLYGDNR